MTNEQLVKAVSDATGVNREEVADVLKALGSCIVKALFTHDKVVIGSLGSLRRKATAARVGRNPKTGLPVDIPAGAKVKFTPSSLLKDALKA
jgi:DNA-binding protein HU-beta